MNIILLSTVLVYGVLATAPSLDIPSNIVYYSKKHQKASHYKDQMYSFSYVDVNFEISSHQLLISNKALKKNHLFDKDKYRKIEDGQCMLYPTTTQMFNHRTYSLSSQPIAYATVPVNKSNIVQYMFMITKQKKFIHYKITDDLKNQGYYRYYSYDIEEVYYIDLPSTLSAQELTSDNIRLISSQQQFVLVVTTKHMYKYKNGIFQQMVGYMQSDDSTIISSQYYQQIASSGSPLMKSYIWIAYSQSYIIYQVNKNTLRKKELNNIKQKIGIISDITYFKRKFFILSVNKIVILAQKYPSDYGNAIQIENQYTLEGQCYNLQQYGEMLHAVCSYQTIVYVTELYYHKKQLYLNRYYNDRNVEGIRDVHHLGQSKIAFIGDDQLVVQAYGINRQAILQLKHQPLSKSFAFFGLDLVSTHNLNTKLTTSFFMIYEDRLKFVTMVQDPPELVCLNEHKPSSTYYVLAQFNTTLCLFLNESEIQEKIYVYQNSVCQTTYCLQVQVKGQKILKQKKSTNLMTVFIVILIVASLLLLMGCAIKRVNNSQNLSEILIHKIKKLKSKRGSQELKQL